MSFLLSIDRNFAGGVKLEFDVGPTERIQMLVPDHVAHEVLALSPDDHIGQSLTDIRPPARTRRPKG